MTSKLLHILKNYGVLNGLKLYTHLKFKSKSPVKFPFLKYPVHIRSIKSDELMFEQIFAGKQYHIKVPIEPEIIVDLGSNVGYASILFANRFPEAKIFALEPEENNLAVAQKNVQPYHNITLVKGAVWNKPEHIHVINSGHGEAAFVIKPGDGEHPR